MEKELKLLKDRISARCEKDIFVYSRKYGCRINELEKEGRDSIGNYST